MDKITIESNIFKKQEYLLFKDSRFNLETGKKETVKFEKEIPYFAGMFQNEGRMYICGGETRISERLSLFFSLDYSGRCTMLEALEQ